MVIISSKEIKSIYGKQSSSDTLFTAKARVLQFIWLVENGLDIWIGSNKGSVVKNTELTTYYGNMIMNGEKLE